MSDKNEIIESLGKQATERGGAMMHVELSCRKGDEDWAFVYLAMPEIKDDSDKDSRGEHIKRFPKAVISYIADLYGMTYRDILLMLVGDEMSADSPFRFVERKE